ncbi:MAG: hypothetical protein AAGB10_00315 [Pseudomonadota bacterium]
MERKTRLPAIGRFRSARSAARQVDTAARQEARHALSDHVLELRERHIGDLCVIAEDINRAARETHRLLSDCYSARIAMGRAQSKDLRMNRARIRTEVEDIVTSDFR